MVVFQTRDLSNKVIALKQMMSRDFRSTLYLCTLLMYHLWTELQDKRATIGNYESESIQHWLLNETDFYPKFSLLSWLW